MQLVTSSTSSSSKSTKIKDPNSFDTGISSLQDYKKERSINHTSKAEKKLYLHVIEVMLSRKYHLILVYLFGSLYNITIII